MIEGDGYCFFRCIVLYFNEKKEDVERKKEKKELDFFDIRKLFVDELLFNIYIY